MATKRRDTRTHWTVDGLYPVEGQSTIVRRRYDHVRCSSLGDARTWIQDRKANDQVFGGSIPRRYVVVEIQETTINPE